MERKKHKNSQRNKIAISFVIMVMILTIMLLFPSNSFAEGMAWDNTADISWYNDTGTSFEISTAEQLAGFAQLVNAGNSFSGKTVCLVDDIILNTTTVDENGNMVSGTFNSWTSIGSTQSNKFKGNFDGNNHTIYNLYSTNAGLFNYVADGSIKNTILANTYIDSSQSNVGALVGNCESVIENCHVKNISVKAIDNVGGIAGITAKDTIYCSAQGLITGNQYIGGIIGLGHPLYYDYPNFYINGCWFDGNIVSTNSRWAYAGGIIGFSRTVLDNHNQYGNSAIITNCFSHGIINCPPLYVGGIAGTIHPYSEFKTEIRNCYSDMVITTNNTNVSYTAASYICGEKNNRTYNCHYSVDALSQCSSNYNYDVSGITAATAKSISDGALASALYRKSENITYVWGQKIGTDPAPIITTDKSLVINYCNVAFYSNGNLLKNVYLDANNKVETLPDPNTRLNQEFVKWVVKGTDTEFTTDTIVTDDVEVDAVFNATYPLTGEGTQASPYLLATIEDYNKFATICNQGDTTYIDAYYKVTEDLAFTENPVYCNTFSGVFDGNGKTLSFDKTLENSSSLFGTNNGTIKNFIINGYSLISGNTVGIICSINSNTINNCRVENSSIAQELILSADDNIVGGIAGTSSKDSVISNCVVSNTKLSGYHCGGIVGKTDTATVSNCTVESNTTFCFQDDYYGARIGGIIACSVDSTIEYCANYANLDYNRTAPEYSGGIVGYVQCIDVNATINHCINYGKCAAYRNASGIAGDYYTGAGVYFYLKNSINCGMISGVEENQRITPELNHFTSSQDYFGKNTLVQTENLYYLERTSVEFLNHSQPVTQSDIDSGLLPYDLNQKAGKDIYAKKDSKLYFADNTNAAPHKITVEGAVESTLYSDYAGKVTFPECQQEDGVYLFTSDGTPSGTKYTNDSVFTEDTTIQAALAFPIDENGTALIYHANQLEMFANIINSTNESTANNALNAKLMNDIDMTGITWTGMASYSGTFDGSGFTIKNLNSANTGEGAKGFVEVLQSGGVIRNLRFYNVNVFIQASNRSAVIAGENNGRISGCVVEKATVQCGNYNGLAGIVALNNSTGMVENCSVLNSTFTRRYGKTTRTIGAVVDENQGIVKSCISYGCTFGNLETAPRGGIVTSGKAPTNSYFYTIATTNSTVDGTAKTVAQFQDVSLAWLLNTNGGTGENSGVWAQGTEYPVFADETNGAVYRVRITGAVDKECFMKSGETFTVPETIHITSDTASFAVTQDYELSSDMAITGVVPAITDTISFTYKVTLKNSNEMVLPELVVSMDNRNEVLQPETSGTGDFITVEYTFDHILPQEMTKDITAILKSNGTDCAKKSGYSVKEYAFNCLSASQNEEFKKFLVAMLYYGAAAQRHIGITENIATDGLADCLGEDFIAGCRTSDTAWETLDLTSVKNITNTNENDLITWKSVSLAFDKTITMRLRFTVATENISLLSEKMLNASLGNVTTSFSPVMESSDGDISTGYVDLTGFTPLQYDKPVTVTLVDPATNDPLSETVTYSVMSYIASKKDSATMKNLVRALYDYGISAKAYKESITQE